MMRFDTCGPPRLQTTVIALRTTATGSQTTGRTGRIGARYELMTESYGSTTARHCCRSDTKLSMSEPRKLNTKGSVESIRRNIEASRVLIESSREQLDRSDAALRRTAHAANRAEAQAEREQAAVHRATRGDR